MNSSNKPVRKTPRAQWHNYNGAEYFVTICTKNRIHYFGEVVEGEMQLTEVGKQLEIQIKNTEFIRDGDVLVPMFVIMPNHVHLIVKFNGNNDNRNMFVDETDALSASLQRFGPQSKNLASVIRGLKSVITKFALANQIPFAWQSGYHDHIIRNQKEMNSIAQYIEQNPLKWEMDCFNEKRQL